jgi:hypothetical protein
VYPFEKLKGNNMRFFIFKILALLIIMPSFLVILVAGFAVSHFEIELAIFCYLLGFVGIVFSYILAKVEV